MVDLSDLSKDEEEKPSIIRLKGNNSQNKTTQAGLIEKAMRPHIDTRLIESAIAANNVYRALERFGSSFNPLMPQGNIEKSLFGTMQSAINTDLTRYAGLYHDGTIDRINAFLAHPLIGFSFPSQEELRFLSRLDELLVNPNPALSIVDIVILWYQDYRDKKHRVRRARQLVQAVINGRLKPWMYQHDLKWRPLAQQVEAVIHVADFNECAAKGWLDREALQFAEFWQSLIKRTEKPVEEAKPTPLPKAKQSRERLSMPLLLACLDAFKGKPATYQQLLDYCIKHPPTGYEGLCIANPEAKHGERVIKWASGMVYLKHFRAAFKKAEPISTH